ncbi:u3 small nucleolar ribonucleoprotein MPP10 [Podila clonocystis]|nr:u3 small nucleolar ribonucleoprotein MPP10 [Podila clonocystis]
MASDKPMPDQALIEEFSQNVLEKPEVFLTKSEASAEQAKAITKYLYDLGKSNETTGLKGQGSMLEELFIDGFDNDQIWEEIHMQNTPFLSYLKSEIKALKSKKTAPESKEAEEEEEEEDNEDTEMNLGLDDEDMGLEMEDTDNMEGLSGEEEDDFGSDDAEGLGEEDAEEENEDEDNEEEEEEEELDDLDLPVKKKFRKSEVDDDFFNLEEFNAMTEKQEQDEFDEKEPDENEEEIDYFADPDMIESGDEDDDFGEDEENENEVDAHDVGYKDFFAPVAIGKTNRPKPQRRPENDRKEAENIDEEMEDAEMGEDDEESAEVNELGDRVSNLFGLEDDGEEESEKLSKHEKIQRKLKEQIEALEQENVAARDWTKKGEASSSDRPLNSLLEEDLDFETVSKPIPVITAESTQSLEDIIKARILEANYDDVVRKAAPNQKAFNPSSRVEISDEKSKKSLAELYEDDYVRQTSTSGPQMSEREAALEKKHEEITNLWQELCQKLDSLSNWHYTPKPPKAELTVVTNAPAISMEEAIPVSVADAALLAPEEIYSAGKAPIKGDTEMEQAERKRKRAQAKRAKKGEIKEKARKDAERAAEREAKDRRLGRQVGDKGNAKTIVRDKMDAVKALSGQKNISFIDREGNKRSSIKGANKEEASKSAKLKL